MCFSNLKDTSTQARRRGGDFDGQEHYDEAELPPDEPAAAGCDFAPAATVDGEPVPVERISVHCSRCGKHDPMVDGFREKYLATFEQAGLTLPEGVCEECTKELWRKHIGEDSHLK